MAYSETVAQRIRVMFEGSTMVAERKMFGGLAFMINGNMCVGVLDDLLVLRLGEEGTTKALQEPHTRPMDFTGTPMKSMIYIDPKGFASEKGLQQWMQKAIDFVLTLPPK